MDKQLVITLVLLGLFMASSIYSVIQYFRNKKLKDDNESLDTRLRGEANYRHSLERVHEERINQLQAETKLRVGAIFYYPDNNHFKEKLVNKRSMIIKIEDGKVYSRLVDDNNLFIDDNTWNGDVSSSIHYIYVGTVKNKLRHTFKIVNLKK